ncbi:MAG: hypothetical protein M1821_001311 [Bathelium mastoideum]|nr:MAG: hypothetical protein M1821_001311 [Bathelium mastoideum]
MPIGEGRARVPSVLTNFPAYQAEDTLVKSETVTMVYDWRDKESECYQLYVEEQRSLDEVMDWMKENRDFNPSKRAYQTQFKRWGFPSKQNPAHKNAPLVARTKQLWEQNTTQKEMLRVLNADGFRITERELMRLRARYKWLLRMPNGMKNAEKDATVGAESLDDDFPQDAEQAVVTGDSSLTSDLRDEDSTAGNVVRGDATPDLDPLAEAQRQQRREQLQTESAERWAARKRRRRTRTWAGMPADPPGPPRFPSETTLDEAKAILGLDHVLYRQVRVQFQDICEQDDIAKKTIAGPQKWQAAKEKLIHGNTHLHGVFFDDISRLDQKYLSLDVLCTDVTKRMRTAGKKLTLAEAKNIIGVNPDESRRMRETFYNILKADHFTSKLETGDEHWSELKQQWIDKSDIVQRVLARGNKDSAYDTKCRALEVICRDVMKRLRDDQSRRNASRKTQGHDETAPEEPLVDSQQNSHDSVSGMVGSTSPSQTVAQMPTSDLQIDPSLLLAASDPSMTADIQAHEALQYASANDQSNPFAPQHGPIPVYFRLNPLSQTEHLQQPIKQVWLSTLLSGSIEELKVLAVKDLPYTVVVRIEGLVPDLNGNDIPYVLDREDELGAYLAHITGGKATFSVTIAPAPA